MTTHRSADELVSRLFDASLAMLDLQQPLVL